MRFTVTAIVPATAAVTLSPEIERWHHSTLDELVTMSGQIGWVTGWDESVRLRIRLIRDSSELPKISEDWAGPRGRVNAWLEFQTMATVDITEYARHLFENNLDSDPITEPLASAFAADHLTTDLSTRVSEIVLAANIARPGSLQALSRYTFTDSSIFKKSGAMLSYFADAVQQCREFGWPPILTLSIPNVLEWLDSLPGFTEGRPSGPGGIAVSALSQLCSDPPPVSAAAGLMWAMVGLEALYAEGHDGLRRQIMNKTELTLGPRTSHLKNFNRIYDVRSRFIHGDSEFRLAYTPYDTEDDSELELDEAFLLTQGMLLASIQKLVSLRRPSFAFTYSLAQ